MSISSEECPASRGKNYPMCTSVQSYKLSTALLYRVAHLGNLLRTPISIGSKIKFIATMGIGWCSCCVHLYSAAVVYICTVQLLRTFVQCSQCVQIENKAAIQSCTVQLVYFLCSAACASPITLTSTMPRNILESSLENIVGIIRKINLAWVVQLCSYPVWLHSLYSVQPNFCTLCTPELLG